MGDIATAADLEVEGFLIERLTSLFPGIPILSEEAGLKESVTDQLFIVDPLDGSTNFMRGITHYAVAVALIEKDVPTVGAAAVGELQEIYSAFKGGGAYLNEEKIKTRPCHLNEFSMVALPSEFKGSIPGYVEWLYLRGCKIRNNGSAVSHICQIAARRFDLCIFEELKLWEASTRPVVEAYEKKGDPLVKADLPSFLFQRPTVSHQVKDSIIPSHL